MIDLSFLDEAYHESEGYAGSLPSGTYIARLVTAEITESKNLNPQIKWILEAEISPGNIGTTMKFSPLLPQSIFFLKKDLKILGIVLGPVNQLHNILPSLKGTIIEIEVEDDPENGLHTVNFLRKIPRWDFN